jgi:galactose mutarotase-like enzyme
MADQPTNPTESTLSLTRQVALNRGLAIDALAEKVKNGRAAQTELTTQIRSARLDGTDARDLTEARRLAHIATILARAELLCRPDAPSLSLYAGDEAQFDDLTILERAKGFLALEPGSSDEPDPSHPDAPSDQIARFETTRHRVEETTY